MEYVHVSMFAENLAQCMFPDPNEDWRDSALCHCSSCLICRYPYIRLKCIGCQRTEGMWMLVRKMRSVCRSANDAILRCVRSLNLNYSKQYPCNFCMWAALVGAPVREDSCSLIYNWHRIGDGRPSNSYQWNVFSKGRLIAVYGLNYEVSRPNPIHPADVLLYLNTVKSPSDARRVYDKATTDIEHRDKFSWITLRRIASHPNNGGFAVVRLFLRLALGDRFVAKTNSFFVEDFIVNFLPKIACRASIADIADLKALRRNLNRTSTRAKRLAQIITEALSRVDVRLRTKSLENVRRSPRLANRKKAPN